MLTFLIISLVIGYYISISWLTKKIQTYLETKPKYFVKWKRRNFSNSWYLEYVSYIYKQDFQTLDEFVKFKNKRIKENNLSYQIKLI